MTEAVRSWLAGALLLLAAPAAWAAPTVERHDLVVKLQPADKRIVAQDTLTVRRDGGGKLVLALNAKLEIQTLTIDGRAGPLPTRTGDDGWIAKWELTVPPGPGDRGEIRIDYAGTIDDTVRAGGDLSFVVGDDTRGVIGTEGAYLAEGSGWYPSDGSVARFDVKTYDPTGYLVVTQGTRVAPPKGSAEPTLWASKQPSDGLSLVAGPWKRYEKRAGTIDVSAYLTEKNAAGAPQLLDAAASYLTKYTDLLGPYAYDRFDIVENWFTTGFGMPEFTLLGSDVIGVMLMDIQRKGALSPGYLDHEIVHCWWGNSVYPDHATGNWCEALTTYCSNYLAKEWIGPAEAAESRRITALRFALRVTPANDYPVRKFRNKAEAADDDIGYGKGSMFFHALRREVGDAAFWATLRRVAAERRGTKIGWEDWRAEFEKTAKRGLAEFFAQGLDRTGAPLLELAQADLHTESGGMWVDGVIRQRLAEGEQPWRLAVPVVVEHADGVEEILVDTAAAETTFRLTLSAMPLRIALDPENHVFRTLGPEEIPACLAATLARPKIVVVHPDEDAALATVAQMTARYPGVTVLPASKTPQSVERGTSYLVFGDPARVPLLASLQTSLPRHFGGARAKPTTTVLASSRNPTDAAEFVTTFTGAPEALAARARAVYRYQFDGRIVFEGPAPMERTRSPAPSRTARLLMPDLKVPTSPERAAAVIGALAAPEMKGRLAGSPEDAKTRKFVAGELRLCGIEPQEQAFSFTVKRLDTSKPALMQHDSDRVRHGAVLQGFASVPGAIPLLASPAMGRFTANGVVGEDETDVAGRAMLVELGEGAEQPMTFVRDAAAIARARGAAALLVRVPANPSAKLAELWAFPETLHPDAAKRLVDAVARGGSSDALLHAAGVAARTGSDVELPLPAIAVPHDFAGAKDQALWIEIPVTLETIKSANLIARIAAKGRKSAGSVLLSAHLDHLGEGFPGADDNASGIAAVLEAVNVLSSRPEMLQRDVLVAFFGAEEWGLRGSRAFVASLGDNHGITAVLNADTVGRRGVDEVYVLGVSKHPRPARAVSAALERCGFTLGRDIDARGFAWGSDHWPFHERGIPAIDLWSSDYGVMNTKQDTVDGVDADKVARIGRALALATVSLGAGN